MWMYRWLALGIVLGAGGGCDSDSDRCECGADEVCLEVIGTCDSRSMVTCVPRVAACPEATCSPACDDAYCRANFPNSTCAAGGCPGEISGALQCYAP